MGFIENTFLGGAERRAGETQARAAREAQALTREFTGQALAELRSQFPQAEAALNQALQSRLGILGAGQQAALESLTGFGAQGLGELYGAERMGRGDIMQGYGEAVGQLSPWASGGQQAYQRQLALSGALGADAQQQAYDTFLESPGQQYLREQGERAVMRNAAATGGLGSGRVLEELQRQGQGLAAQDYQNQFANLGQLAGRGQTAASQIAGLTSSRGTALANLAAQMGGSRANLLQSLGQGASGLQSQFAGQMSSAVGNTGTNLANLRSQLGTSLANALTGQGTQLAGLEQDYGASLASGYLGQAAQRRAFEQQQYDRFMEWFPMMMMSDRNLKKDVSDLSGEQAFKTVMNMDIKSWRYKPEHINDQQIHFGPMAQDAPDEITDPTKRMINVHDEMMLVTKALQYAMENEDNFKLLTNALR